MSPPSILDCQLVLIHCRFVEGGFQESDKSGLTRLRLSYKYAAVLCVHDLIKLEGLVSHYQRVVEIVALETLVDSFLQVSVVLSRGIQAWDCSSKDILDDALNDDVI
jgi:hypothetical protein